MNTTRVVSGEPYNGAYRRAIKEIGLKILDLEDQKAVFMNSDKKVYYIDFLSEGLQCVSFSDDITKVISQCLINNAIKTSINSPFFSDFSLLYTVDLIKDSIRSSKFIEEHGCFNKKFIEIISNNTFSTTKKDIMKFFKAATVDPLTSAVIYQSFESSGLSGRVFFEDRKVDKTTIEIKDAYNFDIETFNEFLFEKNVWSHELANVIVIDGIIENVSEINNLLEMSSKNVDPTVIVARGFGDDVLQTLYVNMKRKTPETQ